MTCLSDLYRKYILLLMVLTFTGCSVGSESFVYTPADEPPPGPGLFSGPDGAFTLFQSRDDDPSQPDVAPDVAPD